jgi:hypothetical protein
VHWEKREPTRAGVTPDTDNTPAANGDKFCARGNRLFIGHTWLFTGISTGGNVLPHQKIGILFDKLVYAF